MYSFKLTVTLILVGWNSATFQHWVGAALVVTTGSWGRGTDGIMSKQQRVWCGRGTSYNNTIHSTGLNVAQEGAF